MSYGWNSAAWVLVAIAAVSAVLFFAFFRDKPHGGYKRSAGDGGITRIPLLVTDRDIWLVTFSGTILQGQHITIVTYLILFLIEDVGMAVTVAGGMLATAFAGGGLGRIAWGAVSDFLVPGRPALVLALVVLLAAVSLTFLTWLPTDASPVVVAVVAFLAGSTAMGWQGLSGLSSQNWPTRRSLEPQSVSFPWSGGRSLLASRLSSALSLTRRILMIRPGG